MFDSFIGGIHTNDFQDRDNGGPECANYMSMNFKLSISIIMVLFN